MKIFLSFRFTGEDFQELEKTIGMLISALQKSGHTVYNSLDSEEMFQKEQYSYQRMLDFFFKEIDSCDIMLAFIKSSEKSEGMLLEIGYALAKGKRFILASKNDVKTTFLHEIAEKVIEFETVDELVKKLESTNFHE